MSNTPASAATSNALIRFTVEFAGEPIVHDWSPVDGPLIIGRGATAGLRIQQDVFSREHARVQLNANDIALIDLESRNGIKINDARVWQPTHLKDGDVIGVGDVAIHVAFVDWEVASPPPVPQAADSDVTRPVPFSEDAYDAGMEVTIAPGQDGFVDFETPIQTERRVISLGGGRTVLGRDPDCEVELESLMISRLHAEIVRESGRTLVRDLNSSNGTAVNGVNITRRTELKQGDRLTIGPYQIDFDGRRLVIEPPTLGLQVRVQGLTRVVKDMQTGKPLNLLDDVSFTIAPRSFVGLLGPSGCGKSTLMDALNGRRRGTGGNVRFNDADLYQQFDAFKAGIGYVPQEVIFHDTLPLGEALRYASRLRLSADVSEQEIDGNIKRVLETVGLSERRGTVIRHLSGGQKKRVSIAIELLSDPDILFLDEVTSGLDLGTEKEMMELFRKLADDGKTIICITHFLESLSQCDKLVCLMRGKLVFDGQPKDMKQHFEIEELREVYGLEKIASPDEWRQRFLDTPQGKALASESTQQSNNDDTPPVKPNSAGLGFAEFLLQLRILTQRYVRLLTLDRKMLGLLLLFGPLIGIMLCIYAQSVDVPDTIRNPAEQIKIVDFDSTVLKSSPSVIEKEISRFTDDTSKDQKKLASIATDYRAYYTRQRVLLFGAVLAAMLLSMFASVQEIVKELPIYFHERFVKLQLAPYLLSKLLPLAVLGAVQSALLLLTIHIFADIDAGSIFVQFPVVFMMALVGTLLGLVISAGVPSSKESANIAVLLMIAVVIPQILFSGGLGPLDGFAEFLGQYLVACYWGLEALTSNIAKPAPDSSKFAAFEGMDTLIGTRYWSSLLVLVGHAALLSMLLVIFMMKKDGPEAIRKLRTGMKQIAEKAGLG